MKVLVTGGAGYIGSAAAAALLAAGHQVTVLDNLTTGHAEQVPEGARLVTGNIGDRNAVHDALTGARDAVLHFAASIEAGESMRRPEFFFDNNTAQTLAFLRTITEAGVSRFVFSSTAAVYGDPVNLPVREDDPLEPTNTYGETKLLVERALRWLNRIHGFRYASLRYFNVAGFDGLSGEMHDPETHLIPRVLDVALGRAPHAMIFGDDYPTADGTCIRDYIHISDLVDAHLLALDRLGTQPLICNLGNGNGFSVKEVIESCRRVTGHPIPVEVHARREGDPPNLVASSERARDLLGWKPRYPDLDDIVASAWAWHRQRA